MLWLGRRNEESVTLRYLSDERSFALHHMTKPTEPDVQDVTARFVINSAASRFTVQAFAGGMLSTLGHNPVIAIPDFSGEVQVADHLASASLHLTVDASSLAVSSDIKDKDRREIQRTMHDDVLQSSHYSEITYDCSRVSASQTGDGQYWVALNGELTLHGVTRGLIISTRVAVNGETLKASGSFSLLQSDYEIDLVSVAGGMLKVKDELKFSFEIVAQKQG
jgi:polyisoprenoid-binding protein YceI